MAIRGAAILLLFSVLLVFFVPAGAGPFSAVHGPATALRANRAAQVFFFGVALPARQLASPPIKSIEASEWHSGGFAVRVASSVPVPLLRC